FSSIWATTARRSARIARRCIVTILRSTAVRRVRPNAPGASRPNREPPPLVHLATGLGRTPRSRRPQFLIQFSHTTRGGIGGGALTDRNDRGSRNRRAHLRARADPSRLPGGRARA